MFDELSVILLYCFSAAAWPSGRLHTLNFGMLHLQNLIKVCENTDNFGNKIVARNGLLNDLLAKSTLRSGVTFFVLIELFACQ